MNPWYGFRAAWSFYSGWGLPTRLVASIRTARTLAGVGFETDSIVKALRSGDLTRLKLEGASFRFSPVRTVQEVDVAEFGPVTFPTEKGKGSDSEE